MNIFDRARATADRLYGKFSNGTMVLVSICELPGANPWHEFDQIDTAPLVGILYGVPQTMINGSTVLASDEVLECAVPDIEPKVGDQVVIDHTYLRTSVTGIDTDGRVLTVTAPNPQFSAGEPVSYMMVVRA